MKKILAALARSPLAAALPCCMVVPCRAGAGVRRAGAPGRGPSAAPYIATTGTAPLRLLKGDYSRSRSTRAPRPRQPSRATHEPITKRKKGPWRSGSRSGEAADPKTAATCHDEESQRPLSMCTP